MPVPTLSADQPSPAATAPEGDALLLEAARNRIEIYRLLAALMRRSADQSLLIALADMPLPDSDPNEPELTRAWRELRCAAGNADPDVVDDEFHALFIGLGRGEILPYASWYVSGFLMDRPLVALRSDLQRLGIVRDPDNKEPEDHAAALCETMALLAEQAEGDDLNEQRNFLLMHISPWMGQLFADIKQAENADFYRAVAALGSAFLTVEQSWLSLP